MYNIFLTGFFSFLLQQLKKDQEEHQEQKHQELSSQEVRTKYTLFFAK